jgi:hypothetical protein
LCERTSFPYCGLADAIRSDQIPLLSFDRVIMLHGGKIIEDGPPDRLMHVYRPARAPVMRGMGCLAAHAA